MSTCAIHPEINGVVPPYAKVLEKAMSRKAAFALCDAIGNVLKKSPGAFLVDDKGVPTFESVRPWIDLSSYIYNTSEDTTRDLLSYKVESIGRYVLNIDTLANNSPKIKHNGINLNTRTEIKNGNVVVEYGDKRREDYFFDKLLSIGLSFDLKTALAFAIEDCMSKNDAAYLIAEIIINPNTRKTFINDSSLNEELDNLASEDLIVTLSDRTYNSINNPDLLKSMGGDYRNEVPRGGEIKRFNKILSDINRQLKGLVSDKITNITKIKARIYKLSFLKSEVEDLTENFGFTMTKEQQSVYDNILKTLGDNVLTYIRRQVNIGEHFDLKDERVSEDKYRADEKGTGKDKHTDEFSKRNKRYNIFESISDPRYNGNNNTMALARLLSRVVRDMNIQSPNCINELLEVIKESGEKVKVKRIGNSSYVELIVPRSVEDFFNAEYGLSFDSNTDNAVSILLGSDISSSGFSKFTASEDNHIHSLRKNTREFALELEEDAEYELDDEMTERFISGTMANMFQNEIVNLCDAFENLNAVQDTDTKTFLDFFKGDNRSTGANKAATKALNFFNFCTLGYNYTSAAVNAVQSVCNGLIISSGQDNPIKHIKNTFKALASVPYSLADNHSGIPQTFNDYVNLFAIDAETSYGLKKKTNLFIKAGYSGLSSSDVLGRASAARTVMERKSIEIDGEIYSFKELTEKYEPNEVIPASKFNNTEVEAMTTMQYLNVIAPVVDSMSKSITGSSSSMFSPVATKTIIGKMIASMRRWMVPLFEARYGASKFRNEFGDISAGYIRQFAQTVWESIKTRKNLFSGNKTNIAAAKMTAMEMSLVGAIYLLFCAIDLPDDDDEDKKKNAFFKTVLGGMFRDVTSLAPTPMMYSSFKELIEQPLPCIGWGESFISDAVNLKIHRRLPILRQYYQYKNRDKRANYIMTQQREKIKKNTFLLGKPFRDKAEINSSNRRTTSFSQNQATSSKVSYGN